PYDRPNTSMDAFAMCPDCEREYRDPADRRFHAQPNACPACGPRVWLEPAGAEAPSEVSSGADTVEQARKLLHEGRTIAIKGLGGVHLACDATNEAVVARLRARKHRYDKPFALMAAELAVIERYCAISREERALLQSPAAPIILLPATGREWLAPSIAPGQRTYGFMLPYTPLHRLLLRGMETPIVLTSGNVADEPQATDNGEARERLGTIADFLLLHDRDIVNRVDDSVVQVVDGQPRFLRRARGYAPAPVALPSGFEAAPPILALGGELKNTFCLLREGQAILSQHLGDLEHARAYAAYRHALDLYQELFEHVPTMLAVDLHPDYLSSKLGRTWAESRGMVLEEVQHHHAHIAACLADNGVPLDAPPVLGIALDGLGYGGDGTLWGGEFLLADYRSCRRLASFKPVPMPGGVQAIREPWRMAYSYLNQYFDWTTLQREYAGLRFFQALQVKPLTALDAMVRAGINSPLTSSCGRLFDAVSALIGLRGEVSYEGQAAIELETAVDENTLRHERGYAFSLEPAEDSGVAWIGTGSLWPALLADAARGTAPGVMAARFHKGLAQAIAAMVA
ncbi:MAG: carbamoyltransferase HypF, partial [Burkholderiales bacterium]